MTFRAGLFLSLVMLPGVLACTSAEDRDHAGTASPGLQVAGPSNGITTMAPVPGAFFGTPSGIAGRLVEGTRCWGNACVDMVGPLTLADPQPIRGGEPIEITFEGRPPSEVTVAWVDVAGVVPLPVQGGLLAWTGGTGGSSTAKGNKTASPSGAGDYVLTVFAKWPGGDIVFAAYFRVG